MVWQSKVPPRVAFFSWTVALGKILTIDNLWKRHFVVLEWCFMCKGCGEFVDHLLLHYPIAFEMWSMIFCLFGICWVMPQRVVDLLDCWSCNFRRHRNIVIWRIVPHCLMWCIWWNRIREALRIANGPFLSLSLFSFLLFSNGIWFYLLFLVFPFLGCLIIVLWFLDVFVSLVYFLCTGLCSFYILLSYLSKK